MKYFLILIGLAITKSTIACTTCNRSLQEAIFNEEFFPVLIMMVIPFIILLLFVSVLHFKIK